VNARYWALFAGIRRMASDLAKATKTNCNCDTGVSIVSLLEEPVVLPRDGEAWCRGSLLPERSFEVVLMNSPLISIY
jgi:hypothetical protein